MKYYSLNGHPLSVDFREAVLNSIAPDKGLYFPEKIPTLSSSITKNINELPIYELAYESIKEFIGNSIPKQNLYSIIEETLNFETPVKNITENVSVLELFHGPTLAFKDVGARFMARCVQYFLKTLNKEITILVATSGDTGGAVANGFYQVEGIRVVILYPKGKVSPIQEKQLTALGHNIHAFEIEGDFDDCQNIVKQAFIDNEINRKYNLTSANSINVARWLPQSFYYLSALQQVNQEKETIFCVPSGNFGNICAGMMLQNMGFTVNHFVAATNQNNVVTRYLDTEKYTTNQTIPTISNAMDVSDPSNFIRIQHLYGSYSNLKNHLSSFSFTDNETKIIMKQVYEENGYILDPHGAVAYLGLLHYLKNKETSKTNNIFLETAHPVKFVEVVGQVLGFRPEVPNELGELLLRNKISTACSNKYETFKENLISLCSK
jgi:threonine synthase